MNAGQNDPLVGHIMRARLSPGDAARVTGTGCWQRRTDATQDQGDKLLGATITHAGCCRPTTLPNVPQLRDRNLPGIRMT